MHAFVRNGDLVGDLLLPDPEKSNGVGIVWCPGLPNNPFVEDMGTPLSNAGFTILQGRYPGSWQSYGAFGPASSVQGALTGLELLAKGTAQNLADGNEIQWSLKRLVLVGNSYGGGVAISALALSDLAASAIAFCPMIQPAHQNRDPNQPEADLSTLYPYLRRCHENVFRNLDEKEWNAYLEGDSILNPTTYIDKLLKRKLLLIHGREDDTIRPYHSEEFYKTLIDAGATMSELLLVDQVGHGKALRAQTFEYWTRWLLG